MGTTSELAQTFGGESTVTSLNPPRRGEHIVSKVVTRESPPSVSRSVPISRNAWRRSNSCPSTCDGRRNNPPQDLFEAIDPTLWSQCGRRAGYTAGGGQPGPARRAGTRRRFPGPAGSVGCRTQRLSGLCRSAVVPAATEQRHPGCQRHRFFSMEFGVAEVFCKNCSSRTGDAGRRPSRRPRRGSRITADDAVGLSYRSGYFRQSLKRTAGGARPTRRWICRGCRCDCSPTVRARPRWSSSRSPDSHRLGPSTGSPKWGRYRCCCWIPTCPENRPGDSPGHRPPLRRRPRTSHAAGDPRRGWRRKGDSRVHLDRRPAAPEVFTA